MQATVLSSNVFTAYGPSRVRSGNVRTADCVDSGSYGLQQFFPSLYMLTTMLPESLA